MEQYILTLPSGDPNASGNASDFTIYGIDLSLENEGVYECALIDCSFPNPNTTSTPTTCFITMDLVEYTIVGSNRVQLLYKTQPIKETNLTLPVYYEKEIGTIQQWRKIQKHDINSIRVQIQTSNGNTMGTGYSIIQIAIRRVS